MSISRGKREHAEAERADGVVGRLLSRRGVLGGLAALPVLYGIGSATPTPLPHPWHRDDARHLDLQGPHAWARLAATGSMSVTRSAGWTS
jgi:hypothetical protein